MTTSEFKKMISEGIPDTLPEPKPYDQNLNHAPKRKDILTTEEKKLAIKERPAIFSGSIFTRFLLVNLHENFMTGEDIYVQVPA